MKPDRITVSLPCHSLHDFPTWLDEAEADALLAAWTAAWHPWLIASVGDVPRWASVDLPPSDHACLGIVPAPWDDRFALQTDALCTAGSCWVRGVTGHANIVAAAAAALADETAVAEPLPGGSLADEFQALGLATLLAELMAQRMRSSTNLTGADFADSTVRAARAAISGDDEAARTALKECYGFLESSRAHYYPVDVWLLDIVLLAESTLGDSLNRELQAPVPIALVATGFTIEKLAAANPAALAHVRERCTAGTIAPAGGRYDSQPLDECTPEEIVGSFGRGLSAWREIVGTVPVTYAQQTGGSSAILPQLLTGLGFTGVIWALFDGTPLPDPGGSRIRWEGSGGACIDGVARAVLDARCAQTILALPERIGDAMDHDHTAVIQFAHHAGTASPWFDVLRRIGAASTVLGTFVTPPELFSRTAGAGTVVSFEPDVFPIGLPAAPPAIATEESPVHAVATRVAAAQTEARRLMAARESLHDVLHRPSLSTIASAPLAAIRGIRSGWGLGTLLTAGRRTDEDLVLEHESLRIQVHRQTGGLLSVRRPADRGNRLSQRLAVRTTRPSPPAGQPWEDVSERAIYSDMHADSIKRIPAAQGRGEAIESRGRLIGDQHREVGSFMQRIELVAGLPLAVIDLEVRGVELPRGPLFEQHLACRFAWNENEDIDVHRSLHTQSIATERGRFTAPWFIELSSPDDRDGRVAILTGGLPWHVRSSPHMLDSILPFQAPIESPNQTPSPSAGSVAHRLAVGVGLDRPWDLAAALLAESPTTSFRPVLDEPTVAANVRLTVGPVRQEGGRVVAARIGLLESAGLAGDVRLECAADVARAVPCDAAGRRLSDPASHASAADGVTIDGRSIILNLKRYEWRHLDLEFHR
jgi:alpha-mannosidase